MSRRSKRYDFLMWLENYRHYGDVADKRDVSMSRAVNEALERQRKMDVATMKPASEREQ